MAKDEGVSEAVEDTVSCHQLVHAEEKSVAR